jgi:large subunit ribosomal protein L12
MEYVYAALLIHKAGTKADEATITKVLTAAGVTVDVSKVKALVASLDGVNIDEAIAKAAIVAPVAAVASAAPAAKAVEVEEKKEDTSEAAAAGLGALFG